MPLCPAHFPPCTCSVVPTGIVKSGDADGKLVVQFTPTDAKSSAAAGSIACDTVLFAIGRLGWGSGGQRIVL